MLCIRFIAWFRCCNNLCISNHHNSHRWTKTGKQ